MAAGASDALVLAMLREAVHWGSSTAASSSSLCSQLWLPWVLVQNMGTLPWVRPPSSFLVAGSLLQSAQDVLALAFTSLEHPDLPPVAYTSLTKALMTIIVIYGCVGRCAEVEEKSVM